MCSVHTFVDHVRSATRVQQPGSAGVHGLLTLQALAQGLADQLAAISGRLQAVEPLVCSMPWHDFDGTVLLALHQLLQVGGLPWI